VLVKADIGDARFGKEVSEETDKTIQIFASRDGAAKTSILSARCRSLILVLPRSNFPKMLDSFPDAAFVIHHIR